MQNLIQVQSKIAAPAGRVWEVFTKPEHIVQWNHASDDWFSPKAENNLQPGGRFNYRMEARDGSMGFNFTGTFTEVVAPNRLSYTMDDGRKCEVNFYEKGEETEVVTDFEADNAHSREMQAAGWQAILNNFKKYVESLS